MRNPFAKPWCLAIQGKWSGQPPKKVTFFRFRTKDAAEMKAWELNHDRNVELAEFVVVPWRD